jgi:hypothetical protein
MKLFARGDVPELDAVVVTATGERLAVGSQGD